MVGLLDVNVLVALFDADHVHHENAHGWLSGSRRDGWATCPITENGLVRIITNPTYSGRRTTLSDALDRLRRFRESGDHVFWPDEVSLCDPGRVRPRHLRGHRQVTDAYLLSLAVARRGRLVTFDGGLSIEAVENAEPEHLVRIGTA